MKNERNKSDITKALYETDGFINEFTARVVSCEKTEAEEGKNCAKLYALILDQTAFFPEGGGQQADEGTIDNVRVCDVQTNEEGNIVHYISEYFEPGSVIKGRIDFELRMSRMQNHSAEHILSGIINSLYGYDNVGFHMSESEVRFDINGMLTDEQIKDLELRANKAVYKNMPITISFPSEEEAKLINYRSKLDTYEDIRLVTIGDVDICACCAPHLNSTGQIGLIKIIDYMPHRQGMRITMLAGMNALKDYGMLHDDNKKIMAILSSKRERTAQTAADFAEKSQKQREENTSLKYEITKLISDSVLSKIAKRDEGDNSAEVIFTNSLDTAGLRNLINACTEQYPYIVAGFVGNDTDGYRYIISCSGEDDIKDFTGKLNERFNGKGGGNARMVQGSLGGKKKEIIDFVNSMK